jgi:predicted transcriptional regulator of viral defense system
MHAMRAPSLTDHRIAALASRQHGVVTRDQLIEEGLDRGRIARRIAAGRLHRVHVGVYAVGHLTPRRETRWMAAVLACGEGAVLSHQSAGALWGLLSDDGPRPHVTAGDQRTHRGITTHRAVLARADRAVVMGIPASSVARTLTDLAHVLPPRVIERAKREAEYRGLLRRDALADALSLVARLQC